MKRKIGLFISARSAITSRSRPLYTRFPSFTFYLLFSPSPTPPPSGSLCFISYLINSSEVQPFTLNPHLPVHMATGWPPITHSTLDCSSETASDHCGPLYLKHILTHTRGNRADQRWNVFFLYCLGVLNFCWKWYEMWISVQLLLLLLLNLISVIIKIQARSAFRVIKILYNTNFPTNWII